VTTRILIPLVLSLAQLAAMIAAPFYLSLVGALVIELFSVVALLMYGVSIHAALHLRDSAESNDLDRPIDRRWFI
jgi:hypothetical protein